MSLEGTVKGTFRWCATGGSNVREIERDYVDEKLEINDGKKGRMVSPWQRCLAENEVEVRLWKRLRNADEASSTMADNNSQLTESSE